MQKEWLPSGKSREGVCATKGQGTNHTNPTNTPSTLRGWDGLRQRWVPLLHFSVQHHCCWPCIPASPRRTSPPRTLLQKWSSWALKPSCPSSGPHLPPSFHPLPGGPHSPSLGRNCSVSTSSSQGKWLGRQKPGGVVLKRSATEACRNPRRGPTLGRHVRWEGRPVARGPDGYLSCHSKWVPPTHCPVDEGEGDKATRKSPDRKNQPSR